MQRTHKLKNEVDVLVVLRLQNLKQGDDVLVATEFAKEKDLAEGPLCVCSVCERVENLLERHCLLRLSIYRLPYDAVGLETCQRAGRAASQRIC